MSGFEDDSHAALERAHAETRAAFANRALVYAHLLDELEADLGIERATALMKRAIYRRGLELGAEYVAAAEAGDLPRVGEVFVAGSPCQGSLFEPAVESVAEDSIVLRMTACVLVDTWRAAGYPPERVELLCDIASAVDYGTFEGAGLALEFLDRQGCPDSDRCLLQLRLRP